MRRLAVCVVLLGVLVLSACGNNEQTNAADGSGGAGGGRPENLAPAAPSGPGEVGKRIRVPGGSFTRVSPIELRAMMREEDFTLVNTHVPYEGDIPGTDLSIPYNEIGRDLDRLPGRDAKIVLYCRSGSMSAEAAETLVGLGYDDVWDLRGGMIAWEDSGFRLHGA